MRRAFPGAPPPSRPARRSKQVPVSLPARRPSPVRSAPRGECRAPPNRPATPGRPPSTIGASTGSTRRPDPPGKERPRQSRTRLHEHPKEPLPPRPRRQRPKRDPPLDPRAALLPSGSSHTSQPRRRYASSRRAGWPARVARTRRARRSQRGPDRPGHAPVVPGRLPPPLPGPACRPAPSAHARQVRHRGAVRSPESSTIREGSGPRTARTVRSGSSAAMVPEPTSIASASGTFAVDCTDGSIPRDLRVPVPAGLPRRASRLEASLSRHKARPSRCRTWNGEVVAQGFRRRPAPTTTSMPAARSRAIPRPATRGSGSRQATTTRAGRAAITRSAQGGVFPWWVHGSSVTKRVDPGRGVPRGATRSRSRASAWRSAESGVMGRRDSPARDRHGRADDRVGRDTPFSATSRAQRRLHPGRHGVRHPRQSGSNPRTIRPGPRSLPQRHRVPPCRFPRRLVRAGGTSWRRSVGSARDAVKKGARAGLRDQESVRVAARRQCVDEPCRSDQAGPRTDFAAARNAANVRGSKRTNRTSRIVVTPSRCETATVNAIRAACSTGNP